MVGARIGTEEYVQTRATEAVRDGGAGRLAPPCVLPRWHVGQVIGGPHRYQTSRQATLKGSGQGADSRSMREGRQRGAVTCEKFLELLGAAGAQSFSRRVAQKIG